MLSAREDLRFMNAVGSLLSEAGAEYRSLIRKQAALEPVVKFDNAERDRLEALYREKMRKKEKKEE